MALETPAPDEEFTVSDEELLLAEDPVVLDEESPPEEFPATLDEEFSSADDSLADSFSDELDSLSR